MKEHLNNELAEEKKNQREHFHDKILASRVNLHNKFDSEIAREVSRLQTEEKNKTKKLEEETEEVGKLRNKLAESLTKKREVIRELSGVEKEKEENLENVKEIRSELEKRRERAEALKNTVSYTHLTLPTIYSV